MQPSTTHERHAPSRRAHRRGWITSSLLLLFLAGIAVALASWKAATGKAREAAAASQPEPMEMVAATVAEPREHVRGTTAIGTVLALRSITLENELAGTVRELHLPAGEVVEAGTVLVALDVSVEEAELRAHEAQERLAETLLGRMQRASASHGASEADVDRARAERDVAIAQVERIRAVIERKTIRAPFRARVGLADLHPGQYLDQGTELTTLQGVDEAVHVDFTVAQGPAAGLAVGDEVAVVPAGGAPLAARIVAIDARVDPLTRNALVRARLEPGEQGPAPGASVRVRVPVGTPRTLVAIPATALRRSAAGDHVFVLEPDDAGALRARARRVRTGAALGDEVLVEEGLEAGERVAAAGSFKLFDGVLVAVAEDAPPAAEDEPTQASGAGDAPEPEHGTPAGDGGASATGVDAPAGQPWEAGSPTARAER